jgi:allophanate hydrolase subunit 2
MRTQILAFASLVALGSVAHADDSITAAAADAPAPTATYLSVGANMGGVDGFIALGGALEVGHQIESSPVVVHAAFGTGRAGKLFATGDGYFQQLRAGADLRGCTTSGVLCAFAGMDIAYQHVEYSGTEDDWFGDSEPTMTTTNDSRMVGLGRVGLDIGGEHIRWRPGFEMALDRSGGELTQSIAFRF